MVDPASPAEGTDHQPGDPQAVAVLIDLRRYDVIVEPTPVVPGDKDGRGRPIRTLHHRVHQPGHPGLTVADQGRWVLAVVLVRDDPGDGGELALPGSDEEVVRRPDVADLLVLVNGHEVGERVPDLRDAHLLELGHAYRRPVVAVRLVPL